MKSWLFEKINKIAKPLVRLIKGKKRGSGVGEKNQINKFRSEKGRLKQTMQKYKGS